MLRCSGKVQISTSKVDTRTGKSKTLGKLGFARDLDPDQRKTKRRCCKAASGRSMQRIAQQPWERPASSVFLSHRWTRTPQWAGLFGLEVEAEKDRPALGVGSKKWDPWAERWMFLLKRSAYGQSAGAARSAARDKNSAGQSVSHGDPLRISSTRRLVC